MEYNLVEWVIDVRKYGRCLNCRQRLKRHGDAGQCYGCGKWYDGPYMGIGHPVIDVKSDVVASSRGGGAQTYMGQQFENGLFKKPQAPQGPKAPVKPVA